MNSPILFSAFIVGGLMVIGHYFPWPVWLRSPIINRLFCYAWGAGWVLFGEFIVTTFGRRDYTSLIEILILFAVAGLVTVSCYGYDHYRDISNRGKRREKVNLNAGK